MKHSELNLTCSLISSPSSNGPLWWIPIRFLRILHWQIGSFPQFGGTYILWKTRLSLKSSPRQCHEFQGFHLNNLNDPKLLVEETFDSRQVRP